MYVNCYNFNNIRISCHCCKKCYIWTYVTFIVQRSEEHTSELQSQSNLVCRLLLEKKNTKKSETKRAGRPARFSPRASVGASAITIRGRRPPAGRCRSLRSRTRDRPRPGGGSASTL